MSQSSLILLLMKFLNEAKFVLHFPLKNLVPLNYALRRTNYRQFASIANRKWIDLETICTTGNIPKTFNFARDVFERHVVSLFLVKTRFLLE